MVDFKNINFSYKGNSPIFSHFSYEVKPGEIVSILGNSGCGKTTLLNLIAGLVKPKSGFIFASNIAYLTQKVTLFSYRTAFENALFACELRNSLTEMKIKEAHRLFQQFNLPESSKDKFPHELSGGMQQRVALIQTLLIDAEVYLFDEPFSAIDRTTRLIIQQVIWDWFKIKGSSLIIVTHDLEEAVLLSDKILILSDKNKEIVLDYNEFSKFKPQERLSMEYYNKYILDIVEKQKYS